MKELRRHVRNIGYILLAATGVIGLKAGCDYVRDSDLWLFFRSDAAFISLAYQEDLAPHLGNYDVMYVLTSSRIVTDDLSKIVFLCEASDKDGIRRVSVTFNGVELKRAYSEDPRDRGFRAYGSLDSSLSNGPGEYVVQLTVTDRKGNTMVESAVVELRMKDGNFI